MNPRPDEEDDGRDESGMSPAAAAKFDASFDAEDLEITPPTEEPERAPGDIPANGEGKAWRY